MAAKVGREDMPAQAQRGNQRQKYLPAPSEPVQEDKRRPMGRAFGIVQLNFAGVEGALDETWMIFAHSLFALAACGARTICIRVCLSAYRKCRVMNAPLGAGFGSWS